MARVALRLLRRFVAAAAGAAVVGFLAAATLGDPAGDALEREPGALVGGAATPVDVPLFFDPEPEDAPTFVRRRLARLEDAAEAAGRAIAAALAPAATAELVAGSQIHLWCVAAAEGREAAVEALPGVAATVRAALGRARSDLAREAPLLRRLIRRGAGTSRYVAPATSEEAARRPYAATLRAFLLARAAERAAFAPGLDVRAEAAAALALPPAAAAEVFARLARLSDFPAPFAPTTGDAAADARAAAAARARAFRREELRYRELAGAGERFVAGVTSARLGAWLVDLAHGDLGASLGVRPGVETVALLAERAPRTAALIAPSFLLLFLLGVPLGLRAAARPRGPFDRATSATTGLLHALPEFWTGTLLILLLAGPWRGVLPTSGLRTTDFVGSPLAAIVDGLRHLVAPTVVLVLPGLFVVFRHVRAAALDARAAPWFAALVARGAAPDELRRRLRRHVAPAVAALAGASLPALVAGSVVVETLFDVPGGARLAADAAATRDVPVAAAVIFLAAAVSVFGRELADFVAVRVDPRRAETAA